MVISDFEPHTLRITVSYSILCPSMPFPSTFYTWYYMCRYNMRHITSTHVVAAMKFSKAHKLHKRVVRRVVHVLVLLCLIT